MTRWQEKAQGHTKQVVGQMIGDDKLVLEGKEEVRHADERQEAERQDEHQARETRRNDRKRK